MSEAIPQSLCSCYAVGYSHTHLAGLQSIKLMCKSDLRSEVKVAFGRNMSIVVLKTWVLLTTVIRLPCRSNRALLVNENWYNPQGHHCIVHSMSDGTILCIRWKRRRGEGGKAKSHVHGYYRPLYCLLYVMAQPWIRAQRIRKTTEET